MTYYDLPDNLTISGSYSTLSELQAAQPTGTAGQVYIAGGDYYGWSLSTLSWTLIPSQAVENKLVNLSLTRLPQPHISGLKLKADVSLGSLVFNTIDSSGVVWVLSDLEGWWNLPEVESQDLPRGWGDGSYDAKGRFATRLITLTGSFLTQTPEQAVAARDKIFRAIDLVYKGGWLIVREPDYPKASWVRLSGTPSIQNVTARGRTDFSIGLKAVDPIKYELVGNDVESNNVTTIAMNASAVTVVNNGNTKVPVIFEIEGALTATPAAPATITLVTTALQTPPPIPTPTPEVPYWYTGCCSSSGFQVTGTSSVGFTEAFNAMNAQCPNGTVTNQRSGVQGTIPVLSCAPASSSPNKRIFIVASQSQGSDVLEIDTYKREVLFNGQGYETGVGAARRRLSTLVDWIELEPGVNTITWTGTGTATCSILYRSGWIG